MPVMDEFKEEREAMKNGTPQQKLAYFWDYYKWYVIAGAFIIILAVTFIIEQLNRKETCFYALMLNGTEYNYGEANPEYTEGFAEYAGIDKNEYDIIYDATIQIGTGTGDELSASQKLLVYITAGELDVMISDPNSLLQYAYQDSFYDLREFLTEEQLAKYAGSFYYIDGAVIDAINAANDAGQYDYVPEYGDPHHPEDMNDPIPTGIFLSKDCPLMENYLFQSDETVVCVMINTPHPETSLQFIDYLMQ